VEHALGRDKTADSGGKRKPGSAAKPAAQTPVAPAAKAAAAAASHASELDVSGASRRDRNAPAKKK